MTVTPNEYLTRLANLEGLVKGDLADNTIVITAAELLIAIKKRILEGRNSNGSPIGNYSTKPLYATIAQFVKPGAFQARGKHTNEFGITPGDRIIQTHKINTTKKTTRKVKQTFVAGKQLATTSKGYRKRAQFSIVKNNYQERRSMYQPKGYKGLREVQSLESGFVNQQYSGAMLKSYIEAKENANTVLIGFDDAKQSLKRKGNEVRFGSPIFSATEQEKQEYITRTTYLLTRLTRNALEKGVYATGAIE